MELNSKKIAQILRGKGATNLYHANTLVTSILYLKHAKLMSRGRIEFQGLYQTPQKSDFKDKKFGIWHDIFLDVVDIHERASRCNKYGNVLFVFDLAVLEDAQNGHVWITKSNPIYWSANETNSSRYYESEDEFNLGYSYGDFSSSLMLRDCGGILSLKRHLLEIRLDNPNMIWTDRNVLLFDEAFSALKAAAKLGGLSHLPINRRNSGHLTSGKKN